MTQLMLRASIDEIEGYRNSALAKYAQAFDLLEEARDFAAKAAPSGHSAGKFNDEAMRDLAPRWSGHHAEKRRADFLDNMRKATDSAVWDHLILAHGFERLMDATAREQFRQQLRDNPPEATADNCYTTLSALLGDADLIFKRGIATAFSKLDRRFRSHDGFKIGTRVVLDRAFSDWGGWNHYGHKEETLRDIERTLCVLDGKQHPERMGGIIGVIEDARRAASKGLQMGAFRCENEYFDFRAFKNGNAHVWFKRADLVKKVNLLLADYYGEAVGASPDVAEQPEIFNRSIAKNFGEFFTPAGVVSWIMDEAQLYDNPTVLEPSAGHGAIAKAARDKGAKVTCVEIQAKNARELCKIPGLANVICSDFFDVTPSYQGKFDRVLMNPPFDGGRDIDHVTHALTFLKPGGRLVAVMSAGTEYREDSKATKFRALVEARKGRMRDLPAGSFAEAGTMINTILVTIPAAREA